MKKQTFLHLLMFSFFCIVFITMTSCQDEPESFKTTTEAVNACKKQLSKLEKENDISIKKAVKLYIQTKNIQDSAVVAFARDVTIDFNSEIVKQLFSICDSLDVSLKSLVMNDERTLDDAIYFKINIPRKRKNVLKEDIYKEALGFFEKLDDVPVYSNSQETINQYLKLLSYSKNDTIIDSKKKLIDFFTREDKCYRSLMANIQQINDENVVTISDWTEKVIENIARCNIQNKNFVNTYLMIRFNRRIIQSAVTVENIIKSKQAISPEQSGEYKWMLLQPFIGIDNEQMNYLSKDEEKKLTEMGKQLPAYLISLDGVKLGKYEQKQMDFLNKILVTYILNSCFI